MAMRKVPVSKAIPGLCLTGHLDLEYVYLPANEPSIVHGVVKETLSKVAVANEEVVPLLTANPINTFCAMLSVWLPNCTQFTPSLAPHMVNAFPLLTSLSQYGKAGMLARDW